MWTPTGENSTTSQLCPVLSACLKGPWLGFRYQLASKLLEPDSRGGFLYSLKAILRLKPGALLFAGLPCSLLIFISRGTSKRNCCGYDIFGDPENEATCKSNLMLARFALLVMVAISRDVFWACEQPASSLASKVPYLAHISNIPETMPVFIRM